MSEFDLAVTLFALWVVLRVRRLRFVPLPVERRRAYVKGGGR